MREDQGEQGVVQALKVLPAFGFEFSQGGVRGNSEQAHHDDCGGKPCPVRPTKSIGQRVAIGRKEVEDDPFDNGNWRAVHKETSNYVNHANDSCPYSYVTGQIVGDRSPPAE